MTITVDDDKASALSDLTRLLAPISRPVYRDDFPLLWRPNGNIVFWSGRQAVEIDRVDTQQVDWLRGLNGLRTWPQIVDELPIAPTDAARLIRLLCAIGAIDNAAAMPHCWRWIGEGERMMARGDLAAAAHTYRDTGRAMDAIDRRYGTGILVIGHTIVAAAIREAIAGSGLRLVEPSHSSGEEGLHTVIVILAQGGHPDSITDVDTPHHDLPHMPVSVFGDRASVGPLVVPGQTSCLRCAHLHAKDADGNWPILSLQLASQTSRLRVPPTDRLLARAAGLTAALLLRGWADADAASCRDRKWGNTSFDLQLPFSFPTRVNRPPHPLCGCTWALADRLCADE